MGTKIQLKRWDGSDWEFLDPVPASHTHDASDIVDGDFTNVDVLDFGDADVKQQEGHFLHYRFSLADIDESSMGYILLCKNDGGNDVNGRITMNRTSGLQHAAQLDIIVSAGSDDAPVASLVSHGVTDSSKPSYRLVTLDYDSTSYVAVEIDNPDNYYETTGAYFTGRIDDTTGDKFKALKPDSVSDVSLIADGSFEFNGKHLATEEYVDDSVIENTNNYVNDVSGSGNGTLTLSREGLDDIDTDLGHTHSISDVDGLSSDLQDKADDQDLQNHKNDDDNPHDVTASQAGARPDDWVPDWDDVTSKPDLDHVDQDESTTDNYRSLLLTNDSDSDDGGDLSAETAKTWFSNHIKVQPGSGDIRTDGAVYSDGNKLATEGYADTAAQDAVDDQMDGYSIEKDGSDGSGVINFKT